MQLNSKAVVPNTNDAGSDPENSFRILISSDSHLGFKEADPVLGDDSFRVFDEVLEKANQLEVDFVLLGGDLFHVMHPSSDTYLRASHIFNKHVWGMSSPTKSQAESESIENRVTFETANYEGANYMDKNHKVRLPIFSIHGNHDCPAGLDLTGALDQLDTNSYVNYFGKISNIEHAVIEPVLFGKGKTKIALYGLGYIKDNRLNLLFERNDIEFRRPMLENGEVDPDFYNILVLHQNRYKGINGWSTRDSITDETIPDWFDLAVWGHEHECIGMREVPST